MRTYIFENELSGSVQIEIKADDESEAYQILDKKLQIIESMGVTVPYFQSWTIITRY